MSNPSIVCQGISKTYGSGEDRVDALKRTDLSINAGELTLLVGPSGSGKTTLVSIMATILTADEGELILLNENISRMSENEKSTFRGENIGMVFQSLCLIPTLTIAENVALPLIVKGEKESDAKTKAVALLDRVHLAHRSNFPPTQLSKGQQQRVAIARAMISGAKILICDEPTSALDHTSGFEIMDYLHKLAKGTDKALVVVTHDQRIFSYADRIIHMSDGEIVSEETAHEQKLL